MLQITYTVQDIYDVLRFSGYLKERSELKQYKSCFLFAFSSRLSSRRVTEMLAPLLRNFPGMNYVVTSQSSFPGLNDVQLIRLSFLFFEESGAAVRTLELSKISELQAARETVRAGKAVPDLKGIMILSAGTSVRISSFSDIIGKTFQSAMVFGMQAGSYSAVGVDAGVDSELPFVITREKSVHNGITVIFFYGSRLNIELDQSFGWKALGKEMKVSTRKKLHGMQAGNSIVETIDGHPAAEIYTRYLKIYQDEYFFQNIIGFPFVIERNGVQITRIPFHSDPAGELYFAGDILPEEKLRFAFSTKEDLIRESGLTAERTQNFMPQGGILLDSVDRSIFLMDRYHEEIDSFQNLMGDVQYGFCGAVIMYKGGKGAVLNSVLVSISFREGGETVSDHSVVRIPAAESFRGGRILDHATMLGNFLSAITDDLVESNQNYLEKAQEAEQANRAKSAFLSNMSHEIRTPINAVIGMDEMILRESTEPVVIRYANDLKRASRSLLSIVNDILDFSKIEAGRMEIIPAYYETDVMIHDLEQMIRQRAEDKGLKLIVDCSSDLPKRLYGDEIRIRQVITNILTNAVKYTLKGSVTLSVRAEKIDENQIDLKVSVRDTGIGIRKEDLPKLFLAFDRLEEKRNRSIEGTGLGLSITKQLLGLMGSELKVDSVYGKGSNFYFTLRQTVSDWTEIGDYQKAVEKEESREEAQHHHAAFVSEDVSILVVDDTEMNLTVTKGLLKETGVRVDTAASGQECLRMTRFKKYDLILLDHRMPVMDGIETLKVIKTDPENKNVGVPVIALSANGAADARDQYLRSGFTDFLMKPVDPEKLEEMLVQYLPKDKITVYSEDLPPEKKKLFEKVPPESGAPAENETDSGAAADTENSIPAWLRNSDAVSVRDGIRYCGTASAYMSALSAYEEAGESNLKELSQYFHDSDIENFGIKVHALKSSSRLIGAGGLSRLAAELEHAADVKDFDTISREAPDLFQSYREIIELLKPLFQTAAEDNADKPEISREDLREAYDSLRDAVWGFDYDNVNYILKELSGYRIPGGERDKVLALIAASRVPDWDRMKNLLK